MKKVAPKKAPKKKEEAILPHGKLMRLFQIIAVLKSGHWTIQQLADRFDTSVRTIYRYIKLLEEVEFLIEKDFNNRYFIVTSDDDPTQTIFTIEETKVIRKLIQGAGDNPLKDSLLRKLALNSELDSMPQLFVKVRLSKFIEELASAIKHKHQVVLKNYHSANSNEISDRLVEPIHFGDNYQSIIAFDTKDKVCKQFKLDRIGEVLEMENVFKYESQHEKKDADIFGFSGKDQKWVTLKLGMRAYLLMREEFPLALQYLEQKEDCYQFHGPVSNYEGIGRFALGLIDDLKIVGPEEFRQFIANKMKVYLN
ncbi:MAG TPA: WYL domain-containing protein [Chryseosolibacter sp.]|nr:WYL domain-containing protein [Chryseosolibacter sp.]